MAKVNALLYAFNRGEVSKLSLARTDLERMRLAAEDQINWLPRTLGPMRLRPGLGYKAETKGSALAIGIPFVFTNAETAILECTAGFLRPLIDEKPITRVAVSTSITNGTFASSAGWSAVGNAGTTVTFTGVLTMTSLPILSSMVVSRSENVIADDRAKEHAVRIVVGRGSVRFRLGTTAGGDELISQTDLGRGEHSLAFTPGVASIYVEFECLTARSVIVNSIAIEGAGEVSIATTWTVDQLRKLRWTQSADVIFLAENSTQNRKIERRGTRSWSLVSFEPEDGPFAAYPADDRIKMSLSVSLGNGLLTASRNYFRAAHVGALFRVFTPSYNHTFNLSSADTFMPAIRISGVGTAARQVLSTVSGTFVGTVRLQQSFDSATTGFVDVAANSWAAPITDAAFANTADNAIVWLRLGFKAAEYTSGMATVSLKYGIGGSATVIDGKGTSSSGGGGTGGGASGVCRVLTVNSKTECSVEVLKYFSSNLASLDWYEGEWSDRSGWPVAVVIHEGRLAWLGKDRLWISVSDAYLSYDPTVVGESGTIQRSIGFGPVQIISWAASLSRMIVGAEAGEIAVRSSSLDEPLTPTNFSLKKISGFGSAHVDAAVIDGRVLFADKSGERLIELGFSMQDNDFRPRDMMLLNPDLNLNNPIVQVIVQRQPDTRIHCIRQDGTVAILVYEPTEEVVCWYRVNTSGAVESGLVLPGSVEDKVYYCVKRVINGVDRRYWEAFAREDECGMVQLNKMADSFVAYTGTPISTITGLSHLEARTVVAWGDGLDLGTFVVTGGQIVLAGAVSNCVVGLGYQAQFKSVKLAYGASLGTAMTQKKRINYLSVVMQDSHKAGLQYGPSYTELDELPLMEDGVETSVGAGWEDYDKSAFEFPGRWDTDSRLCLVANAPRPCTILGVVVGIVAHDKG